MEVPGVIDLSPLMAPFIEELRKERLALQKDLAETRQKLAELADMTPRLLDEKVAASYIGRSSAYLRKSRCTGESLKSRTLKNGKTRLTTPPPPYVVIDEGTIRYRRRDLDKWIDALKTIQP